MHLEAGQAPLIYSEGRIIMFIILPTISRILGIAGIAYIVNLFNNGTMGELWESFLGLFR